MKEKVVELYQSGQGYKAISNASFVNGAQLLPETKILNGENPVVSKAYGHKPVYVYSWFCER